MQLLVSMIWSMYILSAACMFACTRCTASTDDWAKCLLLAYQAHSLAMRLLHMRNASCCVF